MALMASEHQSMKRGFCKPRNRLPHSSISSTIIINHNQQAISNHDIQRFFQRSWAGFQVSAHPQLEQ